MTDENKTTEQAPAAAAAPVTAPAAAPTAKPAGAPSAKPASAGAVRAAARATGGNGPFGSAPGRGRGGPGGGGGRGGAGGGRGGGAGGARGGGGGRGRREQAPREFEQKILELARVTRVTAGGKRMRFRAVLIIGDRRGRVGYGVAKGADVSISVEKAFRQAKKNLFTVPLVDDTIPHMVHAKSGAAVIILKPAPKGAGLKSGGAVRVVLELAGVPNCVSKILGSNNKLNNARATFVALRMLRKSERKEKPVSADDKKAEAVK